MTSAVLLLLIVVVLLVLRQNVLVILALSVAYIHQVWGDGDTLYLLEDAWSAIDKEGLLAIPMFVLLGTVMTRGSIASRLIDIAVSFTQGLRGGLSAAAILSCAIFAAISGSSAVTLLSVGPILYPAMAREGYSTSFTLGALTSGGTLGIIIPPSIPLIIYGIATETSIVDLFMAGLVPGLLLTAVMTVYSLWVNRGLPTRKPENRISKRDALRRGMPSLLMPVLLLSGIYSGYFSPTESAAVALVYALVVELFIYREIGPRDFFPIVRETVTMVGSLFPIIAIATSVNIFLTAEGIPQALGEWLQANMGNVFIFLICLNLLLLIVGAFMDTFSALLILGPLLLPVAVGFGVDPVHLGIIMVLNLEIGLLTPPLGLNLMVATMAFRARFGSVVMSVLPFILLMLGVLAVITFVPWLSLALL